MTTRTITVKGTGKVTRHPDAISLCMDIKSIDKEYDKAVEAENEAIAKLTNTLAAVGFEKEDVKTTAFDINTNYENQRDAYGNYQSVFNGYAVKHSLKIEFKLDMNLLAKALDAIAKSGVGPHLNIRFFIRDTAGIDEELLKEATDNARKKAEILSEAAGVKLCKLVMIDYNWGEVNVYSDTDFMMDRDMKLSAIVPDDINITDTATFVWEIE